MTEFSDKPPYKWKTVRVFISSTFRDFHAERDYLIKYVFPELRQWCEKQKLHLIDIDLRWGVTEKEAESGKVIELCLEQIDGCRPFFICMLGSRYGWIPSEIERNKVNEETLKNFPDLKVKWENLSVTHQQIIHAALSPIHRKERIPHSFFYFRDEKCLPGKNELKLYSSEQKKEYFKTFLEEEPQITEKLENLKEDIEECFKKDTNERIYHYTPKFDTSLPNPEDDNLKGRFTPDSLKKFGNKVKEHLLNALKVQFASRIQYLSDKREEDSLENERDFHEVFLENRTTLFIGRTELLKSLHEYVNSNSNRILAVYGESGSGKSALLAKFYREDKFDIDGNEIMRDVLFIPHFIGASPSSTAKHNMLRRFCEELKNKFNYEDEIPFDPNNLVLTFKDFLEKAKNKVIILIDGLNHLDETDRAQELDWLPYELPENVKIIASTLEGKAKDSLKKLTNEQLEVVELNHAERREIIREMPSVFAKTLEEKHISVLLKKKATSNPLYLKVALEELRLFGSFEKLEKKVGDLPDTVIDMFVDVIKRLEKEGDKELVEQLFCLLECSRYGLTDNELEELLNDDKKEHILILRQLRDYIISRDGVIDFFHRGLSKAVRQKYYLENESINWHKTLAEYFGKQPHFLDGDKQKKPNVHKCLEQPWQETNAEMWDELTDILCDLNFIQAKCAAKYSYDLINDFNFALTVIPDNAENIRKEKERQARLDKYAKDLVLYSKGEIKKLEVPESITPWSEEKINAEITRIKTNPSRADTLRDFFNFLGHEVDNLQKHAKEIPHLATQQAWNYADSGPVGEAAGKKPKEVLNRLLLRTATTRPSRNLLPQALKTLKGHTSFVDAVAITPDGKMALSGSYDKTCILWELESSMPLKTLKGHTGYVFAVAITPDGKMALSGSNDKTCILWDLENGVPLKTLEGHTDYVMAVAITPDGKMAISGSFDKTCILWDLESGIPLKTLKGHTSNVVAAAISSNGKMALSGSMDNTCILWGLESGIPIKTLKGHTISVDAVAITPDGKMALSGSGNNICILWDLESGMPIKTLKGFDSVELENAEVKMRLFEVYAVTITPDGKMGLSVSGDKTCILWDLESGIPIKTLKGHTGWVKDVAISPDGKMALSGSEDKTIILWDLESSMPLETLKGQTDWVWTVAITPDGKMALSGSWDETCILWDLESGMPLKSFKGHTSPVRAVAITPDGKMALSCSEDKTIILWDLESGMSLKSFKGHTSLTLQGHTSIVAAAAITSDGKMVLSGSWDKTIILWDLESGVPLKTLKGHTGFVEAVAITPDGKMALSGSNDKTCILWDLENGVPLKTLEGHTDYVMAVAITPDGKRALSGSMDKTCILWDLESGLPLKTLKGHTRLVRAVAITPDGKMVLSGSGDKTCILWDLESGEKLAQFFTSSDIVAISLFPWGLFGGNGSGETFILHAHRKLLCPGIGIITARQIWDFEFKQYQPLTADCPFCGNRFSPSKSVLDTIEEITKKTGLLPSQSPCLDLPKEVWEEPGLLSECPKCGEKLKFNPFIVGNYGSQPWWKFWKK